MTYRLANVENPVLSGSSAPLAAPPKSELFKKFSELTQDPGFYKKIQGKLPQGRSQARIEVKLTASRVVVIINKERIEFPITKQDEETRQTQRVVNDILREARSPTVPVRSRRRSPTPKKPDSAPFVIQSPTPSPKSRSFSSVHPLPQSPVSSLSSLSSHKGFLSLDQEEPVHQVKSKSKKLLKKEKIVRSVSSLSEESVKESGFKKFLRWFSWNKNPKVAKPLSPKVSPPNSESGILPQIPSSPSSTAQSIQELNLLPPESPTSPINGTSFPMFQFEEL